MLRNLLVVLIALVGVSAAIWQFSQPTAQSPDEDTGVTELMRADPAGAPAYEIHILFIGNSYTYFNHMPQMLVGIAQSDPDNHTRFVVQAVTRGGIGLKELWDDGDARRLLHQQHWDYVVLQEQSFWAMFPESVYVTSKAARQFDAEIKAVGAHTLLFTSWARQPGSRWYQDEKYAFLRNPDYMQKQFDQQTQALADRLGAVAIPVGDYWRTVTGERPDIALYGRDGSHPAPAGSYLAALIFYRYFAGHNPEHVGFAPSALTPEQAAFLRHTASW